MEAQTIPFDKFNSMIDQVQVFCLNVMADCELGIRHHENFNELLTSAKNLEFIFRYHKLTSMEEFILTVYIETLVSLQRKIINHIIDPENLLCI